MTRIIRSCARFLALLCAAAAVNAQAQALQPYVLAYSANAPLQESVQAVKDKLAGAGFDIVGDYAPYAGAHVVAVTSAALKSAAAAADYGGFGAVTHIGLTDAGGQVQVSYLNPHYLAAAYRLSADLSAVADQLATALGAQQAFGTEKGRSADELGKYNYMLGMEHFDDFYKLGSHKSYEDAVNTVSANLSQGVGGTALVYRLEVPGKQQTVFGVSRAGVGDQRANDKHIMADTVDKNFDIKTTAYLPYQILVDGKDVVAMHMRFRMAVWHPDLTMGTFGKLMSSPGAIQELLEKVAGGKKASFEF